MSKELRADYGAVLLFPRAVEEWVPTDHPARFLREFVDALDLKALGFAVGADDLGRPGYAPDLLLKVWLYGYCFGVYETRPLERACREHLSLIWLTGGYEPDHNTLWRFWSVNQKALRNLFKQSLRVAVDANLLGFVLHAVDGTRVQARASTLAAHHKKQLEKRRAQLDDTIDRMEQAIAAHHNADAPAYQLPDELHNRIALRNKIRASLAQLQQSGRDHVNPVDPEAHMMKTSGGGRLGFNAQAVADSDSGMIVAADVSTDANDERQLTPMLDQVNANIGRVADQTVADAGYDAAESLAKAEQRGYPVIVASKVDADGVGPYHSSRFRFDAERDVVICPREEELQFVGVRRHHQKPHPVRAYRCLNVNCPVRDDCTRNKRGREIEIAPFHESVKRQEAKRCDPAMKVLLRKRKQIAELPFAIIKALMRYRRATRHGLENVRTEWLLICTAFNLKKLWRRVPT